MISKWDQNICLIKLKNTEEGFLFISIDCLQQFFVTVNKKLLLKTTPFIPSYLLSFITQPRWKLNRIHVGIKTQLKERLVFNNCVI